MALPKTTFTITNGNLGNTSSKQSNKSGFIFYNDNIGDLSLFSTTSRIHKFNSLTEVEATGITANSTNFTAEHYQASEYFRLGGTELWIGIFAVPVGAYDFSELDSMYLASLGEVRQYAVLAQNNTLAGSDIALLQAKMDNFFSEKKPAVCLYGANTGTLTLSGLEDLRNLASVAPNVSVVIGQDMNNVPFTYSTANNVSLPNLGAVLGALSVSNVSTNILYIDRFNYTNGIQMVNTGFFVNDGISDNQFVYTNSVSQGTLDTLNDKGYIFWRYLANISGSYLSNDNNCDEPTSDYNEISLVRIVNEAVRLVDAQISRLLGAPVNLVNGSLSAGTLQLFNNYTAKGLTYLSNEGDITNFTADITFDVSSKTVNIALRLTPAFSANQIAVEIGYAVS